MTVQKRIVFEVGDWTVDSLTHSLSQGDNEHQVPAKVMAVLVHLAQNHERLVTREELIDAVWDGNAYVGEKALNNAIWRIRQVLGHDADGAEFVKTTPKTGYQLSVVPVFLRLDDGDHVASSDSNRSNNLMLIAITVIATAFIVAFVAREPVVRSVDEPLAVVTQLPGRELYAAPSPDGSMFAFLHVSQKGTQDLYVQSLIDPEGQATQFSSDDASNFTPTWAPDNRHLAYVRVDNASGLCEIVVRDLSADSEEVIDECVDIGYSTLSWSPDGRWLVFRKADPELGPGLYLKAMNPNFRPTEELNDRRISCTACLLFDQEVSWSPDSAFLAVTREKNRLSQDVYRFEIDRWQYKRLTHGEVSIKGHTWDKHGENILYVSNKHTLDRRLWVVSAETGERREIGYQGAGFPAYLPDYESILFYRRSVTTYIAAIKLDRGSGASSFPQPVIQTSGSERNPSYSRHSKKLAYYSNLSGNNEIWIAEADGSGRQQLTDLKSNAIDPSWSPDGKQIAFIALDPSTEATTVKIYDLEANSTRTVTTGFGDHGPPSWAVDGQALIVPIWQGQDVDLWRVAIDGNQLTRLTTSGAEFGRESLDGKLLFYTKANERGLFRLSPVNGEEVRVIDDIVLNGIGNWTWADAETLIYARHLDGHSEIVEANLSIRSERVLVQHPSRTVHRYGMLSYSPERDVLFFTHREPQQIDILMAPDPLSTRLGSD